MIAAWLLYTLTASALIFGCALALEYIARATGLPTRFAWIGACVATITLSAGVLVAPRRTTIEIDGPPAATAGSHSGRSSNPDWSLVSFTPVQSTGAVQSFLINLRGAGARAFAPRINVARLDRWNAGFGAFAATAGLGGMLVLLGAMRRVRRMERECDAGFVDGQAVLFSDRFGPAVLGLFRARIVLPRWTLGLPAVDRRIILAHEREHAAAFDPAVLFSAALCVAMQPWNIALWAMFTRLRLALETDCDRRVLGDSGDVRAYGTLLLRVFERATIASAPLLAFVERRSSFETRVRRLAGSRPRLTSALGFLATVGLLASVTAATELPRPTRAAVQPLSAHVPTPVVHWEQSFPMENTKQDSPPAVTSRVARVDNTPSVTTLPAASITSSATSAAAHASLSEPTAVQPPVQSAGRCAGSRRGERCVIDAAVVIRLVDSTRLLIAIRDSSEARANTNADDLFLITSLQPIAMAPYQEVRAGHIEIHNGSLYVVDVSNPSMSVSIVPQGLPSFGGSSSAAVRIDHPSAISHYFNGGVQFTLEEIAGLRESACDGAAACVGVNGRSIRFPK